MKKLILFFAVVVMSVLLISPAFANFADTYGYSSKGIARGNAMCAIVDDWSSAYYNLSGLGKTPPRVYAAADRGRKKTSLRAKKSILNEESTDEDGTTSFGELNDEMGLNYLYGIPIVSIAFTEDSSLETRADQDLNTPGIAFGLVFDVNHFYNFNYLVPKKILSSIRFAFSIGLPGDGNMVKLNDIDPQSHDFLRYGREASRIIILAGLGMGFLDDTFGVGVGANILMQGKGAMVMKDLELGPGQQSPSFEGKMDMGPDPSPALGLYAEVGKILAMFGIKNRWTEKIKFGAAYRGEVEMNLDPFDAMGGTQIPNLELAIALAMFDYYTPNIYTAGVAYSQAIPVPLNVLKDLSATLSVDWQMEQWSRHHMSSVREELYDNANVDVPEFQDVHMIKAGLGLSIFKWLGVSFGYYHQPSYIPDDANTGIFDFLDNDKNVFSGGLELIVPPMHGIPNPMSVNVAFQYQQLVERTVAKNHPQAAAETAALGGSAYDPSYNPSYNYGGSNILFSIEICMRW